jgi:hypothetical protein
MEWNNNEIYGSDFGADSVSANTGGAIWTARQ